MSGFYVTAFGYFGRMRHVVWDWNGTLFDDVALIVEATNKMGAARGWPVFDIESYRLQFERPLRGFYDKVNGTPLTEDEYLLAEKDWHAAYLELIERALPNADTIEALELVRDAGITQSILSMWIHAPLNDLVDTLKLREYFIRVDGYAGGGPYKYEHLDAHLKTLGLEPSPDVVYIGDSVDDVIAAEQCGISAVAVCTGSQHSTHFEDMDVPVAQTLTQAVKVALNSR